MNEWSRAIILMDMNAFFASIEQLDFPQLRGQPVAVTNGEQGSCIITCSYEARQYGIKTGMRIREAYERCSHLVRRAGRPRRYVRVSAKIMKALESITPDIEVFSVDEAFLDVTRCQKLHGSPEAIGYMVKEAVLDASGLTCSVGISGDKTTAKYAAKLMKPDGLVAIPPEEARARLQHVPVTALCGIAGGISRFLAGYGAYTCGDVARLPIGILSKRFGPLGRRIWYMCQGRDPEPLYLASRDPQTMGHGKIMPPDTTDRELILSYFAHMSDKLGARLRRHQMLAQKYYVGLRCHWGWRGDKYQLTLPSNDSQTIFRLCLNMMNALWHGEGVYQVQVTALDPNCHHQQLDLFSTPMESKISLNETVDAVNARFGHGTVQSARLRARAPGPDVIPPSYQHGGHREVIGR